MSGSANKAAVRQDIGVPVRLSGSPLDDHTDSQGFQTRGMLHDDSRAVKLEVTSLASALSMRPVNNNGDDAVGLNLSDSA